jgi:hypothetical protein
VKALDLGLMERRQTTTAQRATPTQATESTQTTRMLTVTGAPGAAIGWVVPTKAPWKERCVSDRVAYA